MKIMSVKVNIGTGSRKVHYAVMSTEAAALAMRTAAMFPAAAFPVRGGWAVTAVETASAVQEILDARDRRERQVRAPFDVDQYPAVVDLAGATPAPRKTRAHERAPVPADVAAVAAARHRADADPHTGLPSCYSYASDRPCDFCAGVRA
jgi:hypothetical protein